jgi:hypothetical protein
MVGYSASFGAGNSDVYVVKTNANGEVIWQRTYGDNQWNVGYDVAQTRDGGYIITGTSEVAGGNARDLYLLRLDATGNKLWERTYGATGDDYGFAVVQTRDGGFAAAGYSSGVGAGRQDVLIVKVSDNGELVWANTYGGTDRDFGYSIAEAPNGDLVVGGTTRSFGDANGDGYVVKVDASGNLLWSRTYGGTAFDFAQGILVLSDNSTVLTGGVSTNGTDATIVKLNATGNLVFSYAYGGNRTDQGREIVLAGDGGFVIAGQSNTIFDDERNADVYLIKTGPDGVGCNETEYPARVSSPATRINDVRSRFTARFILTQPGSAQSTVLAPEYLTLQLCDDDVCPEVFNLTVEIARATTAVLSWTTNGPADSYTVQYKRTTDANWSLPIRTEEQRITLVGLFNSTDYEVRVRANCVDGSSTSDFALTNFRTATTDDCRAPQNVRVSNVTRTSALVSWTLNPDAIQYFVSYKAATDPTFLTIVVAGNASEYQINNLMAGTNYQVRVRSVCGNGVETPEGELLTVPFRTASNREGQMAETPVADLRLYPNPTRGPVQLTFDAIRSGEAQVEILSLTGRTILRTRFEVSTGFNEWPIDLSQESAGLYLIRIRIDGFEQTLKLIVQ